MPQCGLLQPAMRCLFAGVLYDASRRDELSSLIHHEVDDDTYVNLPVVMNLLQHFPTDKEKNAGHQR